MCSPSPAASICSSGSTAEPLDLLLLDIMMPKVDGLQLLQRVKSDPRFKDLPVLMISSMPPEEATVRSLGLGAADFIPKPFRVRELLARVKAHLRVGRELNQARAEARSRSEMMEILQEVTTSLKPDEIYQILVRRVAQGLNISRCSIIIAGPDDDSGVVVAAFENPNLRNLPVDLRRYPEIQHALATGEVVLARDVQTDPLYQAGPHRLASRGPAGPHPVGHRHPLLAPAAAGRRLLPPHHRGRRAAQRAGRAVRGAGDRRGRGGAGEGLRSGERGAGARSSSSIWPRPTRSPAATIGGRWWSSWSRRWIAPRATPRCSPA